MRFGRVFLGYVASVLVASLIIQGWLMEVFAGAWRGTVAWIQMSLLAMPFATVFTAIPTFVIRATALIWHVFNPVVAGVGSALTGALAYWLTNTGTWDGARLDVVPGDMAVFVGAGVLAGLVWYAIEVRGQFKDE